MPRSAIDIGRFRPQIEKKLLVEHHTQKDVVGWLESQGISLTVGQLKQQCKNWGVSRRGAATDEKTIEQVYWRFHTTTEDDVTIAKKLSIKGLSITARQIKDLRLQRHWRRQASNNTQAVRQRAETLEMVQQELDEGTIRSYGRELVQAHLRVNHTYRAREDDVRYTLKKLNTKGIIARKSRPKRRRKMGGEYIVHSPD
jgi:hypothetical protein